jgi:hypothetical protein
MSSGYADIINQNTLDAFIPNTSLTQPFCQDTPPGPLTVQLPSLLLKSKVCPPPTPAEFALYPKVAVPSSVLTQARATGSSCPKVLAPDKRFAHYNRYQAPAPCQALPQSANMAGISKPSTKNC